MNITLFPSNISVPTKVFGVLVRLCFSCGICMDWEPVSRYMLLVPQKEEKNQQLPSKSYCHYQQQLRERQYIQLLNWQMVDKNDFNKHSKRYNHPFSQENCQITAHIQDQVPQSKQKQKTKQKYRNKEKKQKQRQSKEIPSAVEAHTSSTCSASHSESPEINICMFPETLMQLSA